MCQERLLHDFTEDMEVQVTEFYFNHHRSCCLFACALLLMLQHDCITLDTAKQETLR